MSEKRLYVVFTHVGPFETWATSERKAIANVRFRIAGGGKCDTTYWEVRQVA